MTQKNRPLVFLRFLFASVHENLNSLLSFMYSKFRSNGHYNAEPSRELIWFINLIKDMKYYLSKTELSFSINNEYEQVLSQCETFLVESGGSTIPDNLKEIRLLEFEPIFALSQVICIPIQDKPVYYPLKLIGEGSYAKVFRYKDDFYNRTIVVKRAKTAELDEKEMERFRREYYIMSSLNSPYIVEVFRFDEEKNEYYMEQADYTIGQYIDKNNSTISKERRVDLARQVIRALKYVHSKDLLHRDISLSNVLLFQYDDAIVAKLSDFGLVKVVDSRLTSLDSSIKGSLNDSNLGVVGFENYSIEYETFAVIRLLLFIMTGKRNIKGITDPKIQPLIQRGLGPIVKNRYHSMLELEEDFNRAFSNF